MSELPCKKCNLPALILEPQQETLMCISWHTSISLSACIKQSTATCIIKNYLRKTTHPSLKSFSVFNCACQLN